MKKFLSLFRFIKPYWFITTLAPFFMLIEVGATLFQLLCVQYVIDHGIKQNEPKIVILYIFYMIICTLIALAAGVACIYFGTKSSVYAANDLRSALYIKMSCFTKKQREKVGVGRLITNLTNDVNVIQQAFTQLLMVLIRGPFIFIGVIFVVWFTANHLFIILICMLILLVCIVLLFSIYAYFLYSHVQRALDAVNTLLFDSLFGMYIIKAYHRLKEQIQRFKKINGNYTQQNKKTAQVIGSLNPLVMLIINLGIVSTLWIGLLKIDINQIQVGAVLAFINYLNLIFSTVTLSIMALMQLVRSLPSIQRLSFIFTLPKDISLIEPKSHSEIGDITFQNVTFYYKQQMKPQLKNLNFHIPFGQSVAIIGDIGSGKTTLLRLIARLHAFQEGDILINGQSIQHFEGEELRQQIAFVPQQAFLFSGSVESNLKYGNITANKESLKDVLKQFHIWSGKQHIESLLESDIDTLSYEQKQRISIARALIREAKMIVIDDLIPTRDFLKVNHIQSYIQKHAQQQTLIIATSNLSTVQKVDQLILLKEGEVIAKGTHEELLQQSAYYKQMYYAQQEGK
ncbi:ABC transporter ATP-binding protein [Kurthia gibsonii]|uniref:ABC transporter ATP-binding protein n=1 Tax=Kurthia gibsonii TaxID=33946 RepID=UPI0031B674E2